ncbi:hypothetical protein [Chryseobacterium paridis]|uniref:Bacteriocin n=1 Tax=Chryseobacterium paridis TaxID=2800328 RepID=A0ABS1FZP0_9FLAO|nr:hypothetical protein [Chryseobacterium paridis]MBK1897910.1 hypothetical protein [Chryseobacterium paridis]
MKKLSRLKLKEIKGSLTCGGCPVNNSYGPGPEYTNTCDHYFALSENCKPCVDISAYCFE